MCVYSDSLDWVIEHTPHFIGKLRITDLVKLYNMQTPPDTLTLFSYHNTTQMVGGIDRKTFMI